MDKLMVFWLPNYPLVTPHSCQKCNGQTLCTNLNLMLQGTKVSGAAQTVLSALTESLQLCLMHQSSPTIVSLKTLPASTSNSYLEHFDVGDMRSGLPAAQEAPFWRLRGQHHQHRDHTAAPAVIIAPANTTAL